jgi:hypothetical protein
MKSIFSALFLGCILSSTVFAQDGAYTCRGQSEAKNLALAVSIDSKDGNTVQLLAVSKTDWHLLSEDEHAKFNSSTRVLGAKLTLPDNTNPSNAEVRFSSDFKKASLSFQIDGTTYPYGNFVCTALSQNH